VAWTFTLAWMIWLLVAAWQLRDSNASPLGG
jgi:hypothetical protein